MKSKKNNVVTFTLPPAANIYVLITRLDCFSFVLYQHIITF